MSDAMGYYYDQREKAREAEPVNHCLVCGGPIASLGSELGICGYCDYDLKIHRRLHEVDDRLKESQE